jgi:hypothetical protein
MSSSWSRAQDQYKEESDRAVKDIGRRLTSLQSEHERLARLLQQSANASFRLKEEVTLLFQS